MLQEGGQEARRAKDQYSTNEGKTERRQRMRKGEWKSGPKQRMLTTGQIRPEGWLKRQLEIQAEGLSGHLDLIWPDIRESRWIGGDKEGWERVPYWLDGFIPLAFLLDQEDLKRRAKRYVDAILEGQDEDGWICPCSKEEREHYDVWAAFLICKVLTLYADCTEDDRIEEAVYRALKQLLSHISVHTLFNWAAARWYECLIPLWWLYERRPEKWMLDLAVLLEAEGVDYEKLYDRFDFERPKQRRYWTQINHVVNTAMALKSRALMSRLTGEDPDAFALHMYRTVMKYNSMPTGHFTGDECLSGDDPVQGSECCSVAEAMYSCEVLLAESGNSFWGDLLEKEAFNCLPATTTADMWAHQYVQMTNQISARTFPEEAVPFNSNSGEANVFGLEPNFGCCTANFNQAWPKFALSAIMESGAGLAVNLLVPCAARVERDGKLLQVRVRSSYPFRDGAVLEVSAQEEMECEISVRIPGFVQKALVDGKEAEPGRFFSIKRKWKGSVQIPVELKMEGRLIDRPHGAKAYVRGPLVYALPVRAKTRAVEYTRDGVERKAPYCDYEMLPDSDWNYAFCSEHFEVRFEEIKEHPFSLQEPPIRVKTEMVPVAWEEKDGICGPVPENPVVLGKPREMELQPYGCTDLRVTELPFVKTE